MFDILVSFRHIHSGTAVSGFLASKPCDITIDEAKAVVSELQKVVGQGNLDHITLFTRDVEEQFRVQNFLGAQGAEVTIPKAVIKDLVMTLQIVEVDA